MNKLIKKILFFTVLILTTIFSVFLHEHFLIQPKFNQNSQNFNINNLFLIPLKLVFTILPIPITLYFTYFFLNLKVTFSNVLISTIKAQFVFVLSILFEIFYFKVFQINYDLYDIRSFSSLSILSLINYKDVEAWFIYPLQTLNLFEILFVLLLSYFLTKENYLCFTKNLKIVGLTYFFMMFFWIVINMFLTLSMS